MSTICKCRRYKDIYNVAYTWRQKHGSLDKFVSNIVQAFKRQPVKMAQVPLHVSTLIKTQSIAHVTKQRILATDDVSMALNIVRFMEKRAVKILVRQARHFLYRAGDHPGPFFRRDLQRISAQGGYNLWG